MPKGVGGSSAVCTGGLDATLRGRRRGRGFLIFTTLLRECGCWERSALRSRLGWGRSPPPQKLLPGLPPSVSLPLLELWLMNWRCDFFSCWGIVFCAKCMSSKASTLLPTDAMHGWPLRQNLEKPMEMYPWG